MKKNKNGILIMILLLISTLSITGCKPWTIVKNSGDEDSEGNKVYFESSEFDVNGFVNDYWNNQLFDYYGKIQKDIQIVISDISTDVNKAGEEYGFGGSSQGSSWNFVVTGKVRVLEVNQESRVGRMAIDVQPYDDKADAILQIGPIIKGSSIRDTISAIKLDDFANQVQFASISKAFNEKVLSDVIESIDLKNMVDKEIQFLGVFQFSSLEEIVITPVKIEVNGGE